MRLVHSLRIAVAVFLLLGCAWVSPSRAQAPYDAYIRAAARYHNLPPALLRAVIWAESAGNVHARSPKGAISFTQLMPDTARYLGVNPHDPWHNIYGGAKYLREMLDRYQGNLHLAVAAYNCGPGRVRDRIPNIPETQQYVARVMQLYSRYYYGGLNEY